jgi:MFS family permease
MAGFTLVWAGQLISVLTSNMTSFALTIWMFDQTESATAMGLMYVSFLVPFLALSPIAGAMVDRYNRKLMMMISDMTAITATAGILVLQATGHLQFWHLYVAAALQGLGSTFQWPAYSATIATMLPKEQYNRANGMMSLVDSGPGVVSPILAGVLLPVIGLTNILILDVATFLIAIATLLVVYIPQPERTAEGQAGQGSLLKEAAYGFRYIFARPSLLGLLLFFLGLNLSSGISGSLVAPMVLSRTESSSTALASVESAWAIGAVVGGLLLTAWGGFKRRIMGILISETMMGLFGMLLFGLGRSPAIWIPAAALGAVAMVMANGHSQGIWQAKVAPDIQGRVFSARRLIAWLADPLTPIIAGTLADYVTEPAMRAGGSFSQAFRWLVGSGPGSGMSLQYILSGICYLSLVLIVCFIPVVRNLETNLPDHDQVVQDQSQLTTLETARD